MTTCSLLSKSLLNLHLKWIQVTQANFYCITISIKTTTKQLHHGDRQRKIPSFLSPSLQLCNINLTKIAADLNFHSGLNDALTQLRVNILNTKYDLNCSIT
ncbi:PREDICTED: uncharacterized protein LOC108748557 [Trachymyrmex septentrionalis]|uniref:uncharacterized protein LOC108748557 n=1 Tax=Trachymyrmex septentrionalis TaxID=34720 RepID=UPI00084F47CF|nr:PREDICTED: uncharacterized protein LOC108748557 [Trachymyrmex septentrionalis]